MSIPGTGSAMFATEKPCLIGLDRISEVFLKVWKEKITKQTAFRTSVLSRNCDPVCEQENPPKKSPTDQKKKDRFSACEAKERKAFHCLCTKT